jgi:regulator of protease activity HflC (stomatin/prohibitin superfamily)
MWNMFWENAYGLVFGGLGILAFVVLIALLKSIIHVSLPDRIMVVTGRKTRRNGRTFGFSVNRGRTTVIPYFQAIGSLDLDVFPINVRVEGVNSANGITVGADATACVCIDDDDEAMLYSAVERLMGKDSRQIHDQVQQTLVGNFRGALNKATPLQAIGMEDAGETGDDSNIGERAQFRAELLDDINSDLHSFGMKVVSVSLQKIWDTSNYIANLAQKTLAEKRRQVEIEESRLRAIAEQAESDAHRRIEVARNKADEAVIAARQELEVYRRESAGLIKEASFKADQAIAEAANSGEAAVQKMLVELQKLKNQTAVTLEAEALEEEARIIAEGEQEAVAIKRAARNEILKTKAALLAAYGSDAQAVLFLQEKLPLLYETYIKAAQNAKVDSYVVMNDEEGFSGAVNRGPRAFADFLKTFASALGVDVKSLIMPEAGGAQ